MENAVLWADLVGVVDGTFKQMSFLKWNDAFERNTASSMLAL